ncbi:response regulator [Mucilaginibacter phyllosphaerae]|uniref:CheY-like chemotaxis protein n=1 Tax=Mucilaginibacter phyllosphaerae TaxID=1812349 RepID=A0A4Y8AAX9_9SPHI|nr:response regulator [Mucilaginibacter phyllosphaerae]MBB3969698.1 CheY-like chemotaxis protein [Mucilaginibacter phyllosphaerae]TEW65082.1 response regulator [Mucilaginibacter phyllosphaerae]GGH18090.1 response regulator [Mucilaginibacter phyllosphaerae]
MCKVIVLDDDQIQQLILKKMMGKYGITSDTIFTDDGVNVLEFLSAHKNEKKILPELLFLDLNMPKLNGWRFLEGLKVLYPELIKPLNVYILSSSVDPKDVKRSEKYAFVKSYLIKPVTRERLSSIMENMAFV